MKAKKENKHQMTAADDTSGDSIIDKDMTSSPRMLESWRRDKMAGGRRQRGRCQMSFEFSQSGQIICLFSRHSHNVWKCIAMDPISKICNSFVCFFRLKLDDKDFASTATADDDGRAIWSDLLFLRNFYLFLFFFFLSVQKISERTMAKLGVVQKLCVLYRLYRDDGPFCLLSPFYCTFCLMGKS